MRALLRAFLLCLYALPAAAADGSWSYEAPDPGGADVTAPFPRAEIRTDEAIATLAWLPADRVWRLFVLHEGWDPDPTRRVIVAYAGDRIELLAVDAELLVRTDAGRSDLRFDLPDSFLEHLAAGRTLSLSRASGPLELPLTGSSAAIEALREGRAAAEAELAAIVAEANAAGVECDRLAAWDGDGDRAAAPVPWDDLEAEAAMRACFAAQSGLPDEPRYTFQLGRAATKAGLSGGQVWLREAAESGYAAARDYLSSGEG